MAQPYLIIDGYNLMHAAGMARQRYGPGDLERCRKRVLNFLCQHLSAAERARTTIVFDAADAPPGLPRTATLERMAILFAPRGGDADTTIEELVQQHSAPRQIRLVSSDHRLQKAARRRRAKFIDSELFVAQLENRDTKTAARDDRRTPVIPPQKMTGHTSRDEIAEWLEIFGDIPEAAELASDVERLQIDLDELANEVEDETYE
jgi:predicted RNA-binding protein with PIN domain